MRKWDKFLISDWTFGKGIVYDKTPEETIADLYDLGINVGMLPFSDNEDPNIVRKTLDLAAEKDMQLILMDPRANYENLMKVGKEQYRCDLAAAINDFGHHPATFGFYIGDEPDASHFDSAMLAMRIHKELAPHLTAYINFLPWLDWIGERMGTTALAPYLDRVANEGKCDLYSYDCYRHMLIDATDSDYDDYFNNLREYYLASKRNNIPFMNTVLSIEHYSYRLPTKDDMWWQLSTSVAHGAKGISWFTIDNPQILHNFREAPLNPLGERTEQFARLAEVNKVFMKFCGKIINTLTIDKCYHVVKAYGGMPLFEPFANIVDITSKNDTPLIISDFYNEEGEHFYIICNNTPFRSAEFAIRVKDGTKLTSCKLDNTFYNIPKNNDPIGSRLCIPGHNYNFHISPGTFVLLKETIEK